MGDIRLKCKLLNLNKKITQLQQCKFGKCLLRIINWAVAARRKYPNQWIMVKKDDFKSAYHHFHLHSKTTVKMAMQLAELKLAVMSLRLTFGGAPTRMNRV